MEWVPTANQWLSKSPKNMSRVIERLTKAADYGISRKDDRTILIGALGIRADGAVIRSRNSSANGVSPETHAEFRLSKKLNFGSVVYVARVLKSNNKWGLARPCPNCLRILHYRGIKKVYYTIKEGEFGTIDMKSITFPVNPTGKKLAAGAAGRWNRGSRAWPEEKC